MKTFVNAFGLGLIGLSLSACMSDDPSRLANTYLIAKVPVMSFDTEWITPDTVVLTQELRAEKVALVNAADFAAATGVALPADADAANAQMRLNFARTRDGGGVFCVLSSSAHISGLGKIFGAGEHTETCLRDSDGDRSFDQIHETLQQQLPLPIIDGALDKAKPLARPLPYRVDPDGAMEEPYYLEVKYTGRPLLALGVRRFSLRGGQSHDKMEDLTERPYFVDIDTLPARLEVHGAQIDILELDGERIKIRRLRAVSSVPLSINRYHTYRKYVE